jgi:hypothetical protein
MKFSAAATLLALGTASAFVAPQAYGRSSVAQSMAATETPVYTFEKSEEIFAEAQTVSTSSIAGMECILTMVSGNSILGREFFLIIFLVSHS